MACRVQTSLSLPDIQSLSNMDATRQNEKYKRKLLCLGWEQRNVRPRVGFSPRNCAWPDSDRLQIYYPLTKSSQLYNFGSSCY